MKITIFSFCLFTILFLSLIRRSEGYESDIYEDISIGKDFKLNPELGRNLTVFFIVKDFMQMERSDRMWIEYLRSLEKGKLVRGSHRGKLEKGTIFGGISLDKDFLDDSNPAWIQSWEYPTGVTFFGERMMVTSGNKFIEYNLATGEKKEFQNEWIRHMHTLEYNHDGTKVLITSTGYDLIIEYDLVEEKIVFEWSAWDHGFDKTPNGLTLTRDIEFSNFLTNTLYENHIFVDPSEHARQWIGLSTTERCCHINGAFYDSNDTIGCTFAHQAQALIISRLSGDYRVVHENVHFAHSFGHQRQEFPCRGYVVCGTHNGRIDFLDEEFKLCSSVSFTDINSEWLEEDMHLTPRMKGILNRKEFEWLQFVTRLEGNLWNAVDIKRRHIVLFDMEKKEYRVIRNSPYLSIHEMRTEPENLSHLLIENFSIKKNEILSATKKPKKSRYIAAAFTDPKKRLNEIQRIKRLEKFIVLTTFDYSEFRKICRGDYFPLEGFMGKDDFDCVLNEKKLCDGTEIDWGQRENGKLTVVKGYEDKKLRHYGDGKEIGLLVQERNAEGELKSFVVGSMMLEERYSHDEHRHSYMLYKKAKYINLQNPDHVDQKKLKYGREVGIEYMFDERVRRVYNIGEVLVAGKITSCVIRLE